MVKKLTLTIVMMLAFVLLLAFSVSAEAIHNENTVDYSATVTLNDKAVLKLFDDEGNALIWYIDGKDENGNTKYSSVRADDATRVTWRAENWDEVQSWDAKAEDGTTSIKSKIVVINLMDDDVVRNTGHANYLNKPMDNFKTLFQNNTNLEYCYLRLDTRHINNASFSGCTKLKYINLENLTQLQRMAQHSQFAGCTSLFDGQVLDLTKTQLYEFEGSETFKDVPVKGIKFPETMAKMGSTGTGTFTNCTKLEFVSVGSKARFSSSSFSGCTSLKAIYCVGTADELTATNIFNVLTDAISKSYAEYQALSDKSGVYAVYNYSRCEAFNAGVHETVNAINTCVGTCTVCSDTIVNHSAEADVSISSITYTSYTAQGVKVITCQSQGCAHSETANAQALFECLGYSAPKNGEGGIAIGYLINQGAIEEYKSATGKSVSYGMFAVAQSKLGTNDIFDENGNKTNGALCADVSAYTLSAVELKIVGFADNQKTIMLAMGAYVAVTENGSTTYSYMQYGTPAENESYCFVSYNSVIDLLKSQEATE